MDVTTWKCILLAIMVIITVFCGLLPIKIMAKITGDGPVLTETASLIISLISCFAGGVFIGVCFLDMLPDALEAFETVEQDFSFFNDYPFVPLIFCCGFFFVYIFEELTGRLCGHAEIDLDEEMQEKVERCISRDRATTFHSIVDENISPITVTKRSRKENKYIQSLTFIVAFLFHVGLESFAFGVQESLSSTVSLFCGIVVHKAIICFSIGMRLVREHPKQTWFVVAMIGIIAATNVFGAAVGILIEDSNMNHKLKDVVETILLSLSLGTFIYITFFEIMAPEHHNKHSNILQWSASMLGFSIIAVQVYFTED